MKRKVFLLLIIVVIFFAGILVGFCASENNVIWKTRAGHYILEFNIMNEKSFVFGLRDDGIVAWKYINNKAYKQR